MSSVGGLTAIPRNFCAVLENSTNNMAYWSELTQEHDAVRNASLPYLLMNMLQSGMPLLLTHEHVTVWNASLPYLLMNMSQSGMPLFLLPLIG